MTNEQKLTAILNAKEKIMTNYESKRQARIDRLYAAAKKNSQESASRFETANKMADVIPFGQPILVGHHSERIDRRYRERIARNMDKGCEAYREAQRLEERAKAAEGNTAIYTEDPEAIRKLEEKLSYLETKRDRMKRLNAGMRVLLKKPYLEAEDFKGLLPGEYDFLVAYRDKPKPDYMGTAPYPPYEFTNIGATIREVKKRIEKLRRRESLESKEYKIGEVTITENVEENRVQITFPGKPAKAIRERLKANGFHWSPYLDVWQRNYSQLAIRLAKEIVKAVDIS